jgi:hypothetical protein
MRSATVKPRVPNHVIQTSLLQRQHSLGTPGVFAFDVEWAARRVGAPSVQTPANVALGPVVLLFS